MCATRGITSSRSRRGCGSLLLLLRYTFLGNTARRARMLGRRRQRRSRSRRHTTSSRSGRTLPPRPRPHTERLAQPGRQPPSPPGLGLFIRRLASVLPEAAERRDALLPRRGLHAVRVQDVGDEAGEAAGGAVVRCRGGLGAFDVEGRREGPLFGGAGVGGVGAFFFVGWAEVDTAREGVSDGL